MDMRKLCIDDHFAIFFFTIKAKIIPLFNTIYIYKKKHAQMQKQVIKKNMVIQHI